MFPTLSQIDVMFLLSFLGLYVLFYLVVATSFTTMTVPYNALVADKSHPEQRGKLP